MAVRLRLRRTGSKNKPCYRVVAADQRSPRDGRFIEALGFYDPRHNNEKIDLERAEYWISNGAQPSTTVMDIIRRAREGKSMVAAEKPAPVALEDLPTKPVEVPPAPEPEAAPAEEAAVEETTADVEAPAEPEAEAAPAEPEAEKAAE